MCLCTCIHYIVRTYLQQCSLLISYEAVFIVYLYICEFVGLLWKKAMTMASRWICEPVTKKHTQDQWNEEDKKPICLFIQSRTYCTPHRPDLSAFTKWPVQSHLLTASMTAFIILDQAKNIHWAHFLQCCKSCTCDLKTLRHKNRIIRPENRECMSKF